MMKRNRIFIPLVCAIIAFGVFARTGGSESVRAIQIVSLVAAGFGLGIAFAVLMLGRRQDIE